MNDTAQIPADADAYQLVAKVISCDPAELDADSSIVTTPQWDSFAQVEIMMFLEQHYGIEITEETIDQYSKIGAIESLINNK